jgi:PadR family transcriptional regulator PadR
MRRHCRPTQVELGALLLLSSLEYGATVAAEMREPTFWMLTVLAAGCRHRYSLLSATAELSDGRVQLKVPTRYAALERLAHEGSVAVDGEKVVDGRTRRYFRLRPEGAERLDREVARLDADAAQVPERLVRQLALHPAGGAGASSDA